MKGQFKHYWKFLAVPTLFLAGALPLAAQLQQAPQVPAGASRGAQNGGLGNQPPEPTSEILTPKIEHMREDDRRKRLMSDTARLVALTNELKDEIDKTSRDELSLDVIRKAAEIEKLAHDVRERMKS